MPKSSSVAPPLSVAVLVGGKSVRMGKDKSKLQLGKQTLLERSVEMASQLSKDVIVVANPARRESPVSGARVVSDVIGGGGALSGLHAGVSAARHEHVLVVACDMPFLNLRLLRYMSIVAPGYDAVVPTWRGQVEPLHAVYARKSLPVIEAFLQGGGGRIVEFYAQINVRYLEPGEVALFDPEGLSFFNINTPQDWERAQALAQAERSRPAG